MEKGKSGDIFVLHPSRFLYTFSLLQKSYEEKNHLIFPIKTKARLSSLVNKQVGPGMDQTNQPPLPSHLEGYLPVRREALAGPPEGEL